MSRHSDPAVETSRGQVPLEPSTFALLPQLLLAPDSSRVDAGRIVLEREVSGGRLVAVFRVQPGRRMLVLVTMWLERL
ncbi:hypothetical protein [Albimonas pacifica]|uniref:Uncharacterized protein n=1 Tax=Albimonas pacifica TaxID=1114924 RepID=A0A1I3Q5W9_9RHOB|nr:hypothetical protein [Albimonas pacifica]SFJ29393.1 hypothetical protein SAMN05216258_1293 [Albimonas pacifica]